MWCLQSQTLGNTNWEIVPACVWLHLTTIMRVFSCITVNEDVYIAWRKNGHVFPHTWYSSGQVSSFLTVDCSSVQMFHILCDTVSMIISASETFTQTTKSSLGKIF